MIGVLSDIVPLRNSLTMTGQASEMDLGAVSIWKGVLNQESPPPAETAAPTGVNQETPPPAAAQVLTGERVLVLPVPEAERNPYRVRIVDSSEKEVSLPLQWEPLTVGFSGDQGACGVGGCSFDILSNETECPSPSCHDPPAFINSKNFILNNIISLDPWGEEFSKKKTKNTKLNLVENKNETSQILDLLPQNAAELPKTACLPAKIINSINKWESNFPWAIWQTHCGILNRWTLSKRRIPPQPQSFGLRQI